MPRLVVFALLLSSSSAFAHIEMEFPTPRFNNGQNKWCPCGVGDDVSRNNDGCELESSDTDRGSTSNTFQAGETIRVRWRETIGHAGRFRLAFDPDGADQGDFNDNILIDLSDPAGNTGNAGEGNLWVADITLPDVTCDQCTLQLIQVMNNNTVTEVSDPSGFANYFQCANLVLEGGSTEAPSTGGGEGERDAAPGCASATTRTGLPAVSLALLLGLGLLARRRRR